MTKQELKLQSYAAAAQSWFGFGFNVIPILPGTKKTATTWSHWLNGLSQWRIVRYWSRYPTHEVGFIVGANVLALDADAPESLAALVAIEKKFGITPNLVIQTRRGQHHYFRLAPGAFAKNDSHGTADHPERLDVKVKRSMVVLPPSTGKSILVADAGNAGELTEVSQEFIDAVFMHNGARLPRPSVSTLRSPSVPKTGTIHLLQVILSHLDADCGYDDWTAVGMAVHNETGGSDDGYALYDAWSSIGTKYVGPQATEAKWKSFRSDYERGYSIRTLFRMARAAGVSEEEICTEAEPFEVLEGEDESV